MPARQTFYPGSIPSTAPPPQDLSSYSRFIHEHTKRQMRAFGADPNSSRRAVRAAINGNTTPHSSSPPAYHS